MRKLPIFVAVAIALGTLTVMPQGASAAQPPRVPAQTCKSLAGHSPVWSASYWARIHEDSGFIRNVVYSPCFTSKADCEAWFYWAQSDWQDQVTSKRCRQIR